MKPHSPPLRSGGGGEVFLYMKYLLFNRIPYKYGADHDIVTVGSKERGFGAYENKDAKLLLKMHGDLISEISEESYNTLKKKLSHPPVSYRPFGMQQQEADKNPHAVYAEKKSKPAVESKPAEELIKVGEVEVEDLLEDTE